MVLEVCSIKKPQALLDASDSVQPLEQNPVCMCVISPRLGHALNGHCQVELIRLQTARLGPFSLPLLWSPLVVRCGTAWPVLIRISGSLVAPITRLDLYFSSCPLTPVMVTLGCQLDCTERCLENWRSTLPSVSMRALAEMIGT